MKKKKADSGMKVEGEKIDPERFTHTPTTEQYYRYVYDNPDKSHPNYVLLVYQHTMYPNYCQLVCQCISLSASM